MTVKILIRRKFKENAEKDFNAMLIKMRSVAMGMKGYLSTETLVSLDNPRDVLLLSMWRSKKDWDNYFNSDVRREAERHYEEIIEGDTKYEYFQMGM